MTDKEKQFMEWLGLRIKTIKDFPVCSQEQKLVCEFKIEDTEYILEKFKQIFEVK